MYRRRHLLSLFIAAILSVGITEAAAHHSQILRSLRQVLKSGDFPSLRKAFADDAWDGRAGSVAGKSLQEITRVVSRTALATGATNGDRMVMGLKLYQRGRTRPDWIYALGRTAKEPIVVQVDGHTYSVRWKIVGLTRNQEAAEKFLGKAMSYDKSR